MEFLIIIIILGIVIYFTFQYFGYEYLQKDLELNEVARRERLSTLLTYEMRRWEASDPQQIGWEQCYIWGKEWVLRQANIHPALADKICQKAYLPILQEKVETKIGWPQCNLFRQKVEEEIRKCKTEWEKRFGKETALNLWWEDIDFWWEPYYKEYIKK